MSVFKVYQHVKVTVLKPMRLTKKWTQKDINIQNKSEPIWVKGKKFQSVARSVWLLTIKKAQNIVLNKLSIPCKMSDTFVIEIWNGPTKELGIYKFFSRVKQL